ncbi:MAG: serine/threonine protein kinase [Desulforhopalus sp.]
MPTRPDTILLFGLSESETSLVRRLVASFAIDIVPITISTVRQYIQNHPDKKTCLVIFRVGEQHQRHDRVIQLIRDFVGSLVPFLILIPESKIGDVLKYIRAGADDFMELPLNENRFSIAFLILLEMGQALVVPPPGQLPVSEIDRKSGGDIFRRLVNFFQEGLNYFTPKSLAQSRSPDNITDRWQQLRLLGKGGFGVVHLIQEMSTGRLAVAKTPHSSQMNIRVLRSAAILKRLVHHPNIVQLIEVVKDSGKFVLIQEYAEGPTLQKLLEQGLSPIDKENFFLQLVSAISYAHKHKILHRDIKPENIIINKSNQVKLLDFGIARDLSWQTPGGGSEGTVNFMPPEQFEGKSCIASDVWPLGVIFFLFATNTLPYFQLNDQYPADIKTTIGSKSPITINPNLAPGLERIIMRCLQSDLNLRYISATELLEDLQSSFPEFGKGRLLPK